MNVKVFLTVGEIFFFENNQPLDGDWHGDPASSLSTLVMKGAKRVHKIPAALLKPLTARPFDDHEQLGVILDAIQTRLPEGIVLRVRLERVEVAEGERILDVPEVPPSGLRPSGLYLI